jgi:hypothetical protein
MRLCGFNFTRAVVPFTYIHTRRSPGCFARQCEAFDAIQKAEKTSKKTIFYQETVHDL